MEIENSKLRPLMLLAFVLCLGTMATWAQETEVEEQPEEIMEEQAVVMADQMPIFNGCEVFMDDLDAAAKCSDRKIIEYVVKHVKYPELAKENDIEGRVYIKFVVDKEGNVTDATVLRGTNDLLDQEALRVVKSMPMWTPGEQNGKPVKVVMRLPVMFKLG